MPKIEYSFKADHALNFDRDEHDHVGHLLSFKLGTDVTLTEDIALMEPTEHGDVDVCGVITELKWGGSPEDEMELSALISGANRQQVMNVVHKNVTEVSVKLDFVIYDYDNEATEWFTALTTKDTEISGFIKPKAGDRNRVTLELEVASKADDAIRSPQLWEMSVTIKPGKTVEAIHFLTSSDHKIVKDWGVATA